MSETVVDGRLDLTGNFSVGFRGGEELDAAVSVANDEFAVSGFGCLQRVEVGLQTGLLLSVGGFGVASAKLGLGSGQQSGVFSF